jgi:hypothetical protein
LAAAGLVLKVHIGQLQAGVILHDETSVRFLEGPRRREAAVRRIETRNPVTGVTLPRVAFAPAA